MSEAKSSNLDLSHKDNTLRVLPRPPLLSSQKFGWNGIQVQYHQQPAWENPEHCTQQHVIAIGRKVGERVLDGRRQNEELKQVDIVIVPAKIPHKSLWNRESDFTLLLLEPTYLAHIAHESIDVERVQLIPHFAHPNPLLYGIGFALKQQLESEPLHTRLYVDSLVTALSIHLLQHYCIHQQIIRDYQDGLPKYKLQQALDYIHTSLTQDLSLDAIADTVGISKYYFCRLFKQSTGLSPYQYLLRCRIERAKQLLLHTELTLAEIALQVGFATQSQFGTHFRKLIGVTPTEYHRLL